MQDFSIKANQAVKYIQTHIKAQPQIGIVLGSGLGPLVNILSDITEIDYKDIPNFPLTTVEGHSGKLVLGSLGGKSVMVMKGRFHYYEGYDISEVTFAIRVFRLLGIKDLLVTNAAGGINKAFQPGDLMLITDHISFFAPSPLRGMNLEQFGVRFPDMTQAYDRDLLKIAKKAADTIGTDIKSGVYAFAQGPMFETPAEIRALSVLGADAVGMSTVPEVITAKHSGMKVLGISCITNMAAGILDQPLDHIETINIAKEAENKFTSLVSEIVKLWTITA